MKISFKKLIYIFLILIVGLSLTIFLKRPNLKKKVVINDYINISELSNEFMEEYVDNVRNIESGDKENILIVTSLEGIDNDYGAFNIIEAPNNQYYLQYDSKESKDNAFKKLQQDSNIIVEENYVFYLEMETNTNYNSWGVEKLGFDDVINNVDPNSLNEVTVAVIDSGVHFAEFNQYYEGRIDEVYDLHHPEITVMTDSNPTEHGTHIAGTIAETTPENVKILPVKVTDKDKTSSKDDGTLYLTDIITVINVIAQEKKADVISMSFGNYDLDLSYQVSLSTAITAANDENIICVASAGNKSISKLHYPSSFENVISVAAVDSHFEKTFFSSYGETIDFAAPGYNIKSFTKDPNVALKHGTSMATPHVSSSVAILKSFNKDLNFDDTMTLLKKNAIDIGDDGYDEFYGYGVINFNEAKFCNKDVTCDEYGVFELDDTNTLSTIKIESPNIFVPEYNYGNMTNIMLAEINLYYTNNEYYTKTLGQLIDNIDIIGYDPCNYNKQEVIIKYNDLETTMIVDNSNLSNGWDYEVLDDDTIKLTEIYYNPSLSNEETYEIITYPQTIYIPNELDGKKVSVLGNSLFYNMDRLKRVVVPNGVEKIESNVFGKKEVNNFGLINIIIPDSVSYISDDTFKNNDNIILYSIKNSYAYEYSINKQLKNMYIDNINISLVKKDYKAFETVDKDKIDIIVYYDGIKQIQEEIKKDDYIIKYVNDNDSFRFGDNKFSVLFNTKLGYQIEENISVNVNKAIPNYEIPDNIIGVKGNTLESIKLPDGFSWKDNSLVLNEKGMNKFYADYVPKDNINYETINDIEIPVLVENKIIVPKFDIQDIMYNGTNEIPIENIKIENLDISEYEVISTKLEDNNVGEKIAKIKIRLTDEKFIDFSLKDGLQEYEYEVNVNIIPEKLKKPILWESKTYNGEEQEAEIYGFQDSKMNITGNFRTEVGEYDVVISLKNNNYIWEDDTKDDLVLKFIIKKAAFDMDYNSSGNIVKYDGNYHGINLEVNNSSNINIKYMDQNGEYTLDDMPKYKEIGEYIIKFRLYIDENYTDIIGEETLKIISSNIINNTKDYEGFYDGLEHSFNIDIDVLDYDIKYSIGNKDYNLEDIPRFKNVGEYIVNYKITSLGYDDLISSNKVIIYGIKEFDQSLKIKDNIIITKNNSFSNLTNKIKVFSKKTLYSHYNNNDLITSDIIKTGESIKININDSLDLSYLISILGDVNSDGKISSADYIKIRKHIMETEKINNNIYFYSADINSDNKISSADYIKIKRYIMKGESL